MNKIMDKIWHLNALVNELHEPNCLTQGILEKWDGFLEELKETCPDEDERRFLDEELRITAERLEQTIDLLERLKNGIKKAGS